MPVHTVSEIKVLWSQEKSITYILSIQKKLDHVDSVDCVLDDKIFNQEYKVDFKVDW